MKPHLSVLLPLTLILPLSTSSPLAQHPPPPPPCTCYSLTSADTPFIFTHNEIWDFRAQPLPQPQDQQQQQQQQPTLLSQTPLVSSWRPQTWHRPPSGRAISPMHNEDANVFLTPHPDAPAPATTLMLRATRHADHTSTAEIESTIDSIKHCSLRVRMRLVNLSPTPGPVPPGVCAGLFIYNSATSESDIEILTHDPLTMAHYANQPDYDPVTDAIIPGSMVIVPDLPRPWTEWSTHRLDWVPGESAWYADGKLVARLAYGVMQTEGRPILNLWSDGGGWTGDMPVGSSVGMAIEWVQLAYNLTTDAVGQCETVCDVEQMGV
ncbi:glycoside hydrolase family 16 protein [Aspergillus candidus]|uniref:Concanavalin A-like lectin/glucanase domain-containing protein n=1 Tax=Aspergillus candidus TaxID=41067 RepID=A0A2I2F5I1_ASPCN|nr:concanavalin A-like lectin/glucanase domain-containing protein [Aspergillus candidus]PLB35919.1 concanavalin A-like lectin/glucanase domain-containing protein [Aspergillus candidus]